MQLAQNLRNSEWKIPQVLLLGELMTKAPDVDRTLRVGRWIIHERDLYRVLHSINAQSITQIREYCWFNRYTWDKDKKQAVSLLPTYELAEAAFDELWRALKAHGVLKPIR